MLNSSHPYYLPSAEPIYTGFERPRLRVSAVEVNWLFDVYKPWEDFALYLRISIRTLERRWNGFNITVSDRTRSRGTYTTASDEQLCSVVREALQILPGAGETYIIEACCQRNVLVQRQSNRDAINTVDTVSRALLKSTCIMRRVYNVPAPNPLW